MEEISGNTSSELLTLLVDGELESSKEVSLYASLAESDELRNEMREHLAIRESIRKDTEAFTPPPSTKKAILTAIGLTPGAVANAPITQAAIQAGFWSGFWAKVWVPVVSAVVATIITSLLFLNFYDKGGNLTRSGSSLKNIPVVSSTEKVVPDKPTQTLSRNEIVPPFRKNRNISNSNVSHPTAIQNINYNEANVTNIDSPTQPIEIASLGTERYMPSKLNYSQSVNTGYPIIAFTPKQYASLNQVKLSDLNITFILRGISAKSFPTVEMPSQSDLLFPNIGVGAYITLIDGLDVGMEVGQETFGLIYLNKKKGEIDYKKPVIFWSGIGIKGQITKHVEFLAGAKPFIQAFVGGTRIGPTVKMTGGLEYSWDSGLGFLLGIEGSSLFYNEQGKWYSTEKLGFTYGMLYKF